MRARSAAANEWRSRANISAVMPPTWCGSAVMRVDHLDETEEVHLDVVVDGEPGNLFHGAHHQLGPADAERSVDHVHAVAGYLDPGITRQADHPHVAVVGRHVDQHERVG